MDETRVVGGGSAFRRAAMTWGAALLAVMVPAAALGNPITVENAKPGSPPSEWDASDDANSLGFTTDISVNVGGTIDFKISTDATAYHLDIYRMGYYQGNGARKVASVPGTPITQPDPLTNPTLGWVDCANWAVSASWTVPADAVSGIYFARLVRDDATTGSSLIVFVVRDDAGHSDLLFQTSDATWQAYNSYGGYSLYGGTTSYPGGRACKVSYNRPFITRTSPTEDFVFNAEYPMVRWLEANGYDVAYSTNVDTDRRGSLILNHKTFLSVGHDEYWSGGMRASVEAARNAGVNLAFFSGNEIYWKTRYAPDSLGTDWRTLVCYKEGTLGENQCGGKCDPEPSIWTGLWRDGCNYVPANDGCRPENALSGTISWVGSTGTLQVPSDYKDLRFWRNSGIAGMAPGQTVSLATSTLGYEWDPEQPAYAANYPPNRVLLSRTDLGGQTHHMSLYRQPGGGLVFSAGTVQWSWGLDGNHDRGGSTPDPNMQQATVNILADMGATAGSLQPGLVASAPILDSTGPVSSIGFPIDGGSLPASVPISVSGTAIDAAGGIVGGVEVSVDGGATWSRAAGTASWTFAWTPGAPGTVNLRTRSVDDYGNLEVPGPGITVTVTAAPPPTCPCSIWSTATLPPSVDAGDPGAIEVGVKLRSDVAGFITGVRYYKSAANGGTHVGRLWATDSTLLASATFAGETGSGWQQVLFDPPGVLVTAGTTYVASVSMPQGHYSAQIGGFAAAGVDNPPLHALQDGVDGPNGVYVYGPGGTYPTSSWSSSNYFVDVVLETETGPDVTPPTVVALSPGNGATGVAAGANVTAGFSEGLDPATVSAATFELRDPLGAMVPASVSYAAATRSIVLDPDALLLASTTYTATVRGGVADPRIKDLAGNALGADVTWSFTIASPPPPPPDEGPGGPILVVGSAANPFGRYFAEILRTEGLNEFTATDIALLAPAVLAAHDVVVLGETPLTAAQVTMLTDWVNGGGTLIAMRPDPQLAGLLGLTPAGGTLANKYLRVDTSSGPGAGIVGETIQFHGAADLYTLSGATALATLYSDAVTATPNPAVTQRSVGTQGGRAIAFTYDLARSVVYTRQGNPAWAGQKRDGQIEPIRSDDMFFGNASFDPQPDWIDFNKIAIPQADEQQRLLANAILEGNLHRMPLPRFWYFPKGKKAVIIMTGDDHASSGMAPRFDVYLSQDPPGCSLDDWECIRASGYLYPDGAFSQDSAAYFTSRGFEVGLHVDTGCGRWTAANLDPSYFTPQLNTFAGMYPNIPPPSTNRTHCISWSDWSTEADVSVAHGIRLDTNYYYWPSTWVQDRPGMFTGSGMPMRFARLDGSIIDCYQAVTQMPDESGESFPSFVDALFDKALGPEGYYGAFTTNMHFDSYPNHGGSDAIVVAAKARGVPVVSGRQMLRWLDARNASTFGGLAWNDGTLSFTISADPVARNIEAMLPTLAAVGALSRITADGSPVAYRTETIKGIEYAIFPAASGSYAATYEVDTTPPVISAVGATPLNDGTATVVWTTDEPSDSRVDFGTAPAALSLSAANATLVTSHALTLPGLTPNTVFYYRVTSRDAASNAAVSPAPPADPASFTTPPPPCFEDKTAAQFAAGDTTGGGYVAWTDDGEVTLKPAAGAEFSGAGLDPGWQALIWSAPGGATVSGGRVTLNGTRIDPEPFTPVGPGHVLEFVATFQNTGNQHAGFGAGPHDPPNEIFNTTPWAIFSTMAGGGLYARAYPVDHALPATVRGVPLLGAPHLYRIEWLTDVVRFYIDGALADTIPGAVAGPMRPAAGDYLYDATSLVVDWMRMTPYVAGGTFTSRVFDALAATNWGVASWTADLPTGTGVAVSVRRGNTPAPDGSWSAWTGVPNGGSVGGNSRYIQYRMAMATTDPSVAPLVRDVTIGCNAGADTNPPAISGIVATPDPAGGQATVVWTTDEPATSRVDYGTTPGALSQHVAQGALVLAHDLLLTGLSPGTTYYYQVTSTDGSGNVATSPATPGSFATPLGACFVDRTVTDFAAGAPGASTFVSDLGDGDVILKPALIEEFGGASLPASWGTYAWGSGGGATVAGGQLTVDGARANPDPYALTPGGSTPVISVEFRATFSGDALQHVGLGAGNNSTAPLVFNSFPWAIFGTGAGGGVMLARTNVTGTMLDTAIPGPGGEPSSYWLGAPHVFRIDWSATSVDYFIDGVLRHSEPIAVPGPMRPAISDYASGGGVVSMDWLRVMPYPAAGTFLSRVFDGGGSSTWGNLTWTADLPAGTSLGVSTRRGNAPVPDETWSAFVPVAASGDPVGGSSRYVQYRADLGSTDPFATPVLHDVSLTCSATADVTPPVITNVGATPSGTQATVSWSTDEPASSRVDYGTSPAALASSVASAALTLSHSLLLPGLVPGTAYYYRVTSADAAGNSTSDPAAPAPPLTFSTPLVACFADAIAADFASGSLGAGTYVAVTGDGEVVLAPRIGEEFSGTALPVGWQTEVWSAGGTSNVAGGLLTVSGAHASPGVVVGPGTSLEFVATFRAGTFQNVGFSSSFAFGAPWVTIGVGNTPNAVYARASDDEEIPIEVPAGAPAGYWLNAPHRYRIDWKSAGGFDVFVDGSPTPLASIALSVGTGMIVQISDYTVDGAALDVDWLRATPYATSGVFLSRVYDAGSPSSWGALTWSGSTPTGTSLAVAVREGGTPAPDPSWTPFAPVAAPGAIVGGVSRYIQYRATLGTTDTMQTPALADLQITCGPCNAPAPATIADLSASASGNAGGGRAFVRLGWTGVPAGQIVTVYRKAYGDYPLYRAGYGGAPIVPGTPQAAEAAGWLATSVHGAGDLDAPPARGFWYYVAFVANDCGVVSTPSNLSAGTLDYVLGDVSDGASVCAAGGEAGDAIVSTPDLSALGSAYGQVLSPSDDRVCFDVGPTVDNGVRSRPAPDGRLDFEDLVIYALNFEVPLPAVPARARPAAVAALRAPAPAAPLGVDRDELVLVAPSSVSAGDRFDVALRFRGTGAVHALSSRLAWDASVAECAGASPGSMLTAAGGVVLTPRAGTVDAAVLGRAAPGILGEGDLAVVSFRALRDGDPLVRIAGSLARDAGNRAVTLGAAGSPTATVAHATRLGPVFPNPFQGALNVSFSLARDARVRLVVYDLAGRLVRQLEDGARPAGLHVVTWDGRGDAGGRAAPGFYIVRFESGEVRQNRRVQLIR